MSKDYWKYVPEFLFLKYTLHIRNGKIRYLITSYPELRYIFFVFSSSIPLQRCITWHGYDKILLSRARSPFWKCWINPVVHLLNLSRITDFCLVSPCFPVPPVQIRPTASIYTHLHLFTPVHIPFAIFFRKHDVRGNFPDHTAQIRGCATIFVSLCIVFVSPAALYNPKHPY